MVEASMLRVRVAFSIVEALGLLLTTWRLYFRLKIDRFWWEDAFAAIMLATGIPWLIAYWTYLLANGLTSIVASWFYNIGFGCIVTWARMSVLFSIIRIIHGSPCLLRFTYACVACFAICSVILIIEKAVQCGSNPRWHHVAIPGRKPLCLVQPHIWIFEFTTDCVAVSILVVLPLRMLWRVKLPRRQRRMILSIFASSVVLAFATLFHTVGQITNVYDIMAAGLHVEVALSLIVCNLLVVVTYAYQFLLHGEAAGTVSTEDTSTSQDDDFTTRPRRPISTATSSLPLTTIDLEASVPDQHSSATLGSA